jgi:hypothetical protein
MISLHYLLLLASALFPVDAFVVPFRRPHNVMPLKMGLGDFFRDLGKDMDNLIDDAMDRKLGGGSVFYGERKSSFSETSKSYESVSQQEADKRDTARNNVWVDPFASFQGGQISGEELRTEIFDKWGQRFPVLIKRIRDALGEQRLYLVIQWKFLGKGNLNLSLEEYIAESDAVAELLTSWGVANMVRNEILESTARPKTMTQQYPGLFILLEVDQSIVETW